MARRSVAENCRDDPSFPVENAAVLRSRSRSGAGGLEEWESRWKSAPRNEGSSRRAGRIPRRRTEECLGGWWRASQTRTQGGTRERGKSRNQERCEIPNSSLSVPDVPALSARTRPVVSLNGLGGGGLSEGPGSKSPPSLLFSDRERESTGGCWKGRYGRGNDWLRMEEKGKGRRGGEVDICPRQEEDGKRKREWKGAQRLVNGRFKTGAPSSRPEER